MTAVAGPDIKTITFKLFNLMQGRPELLSTRIRREERLGRDVEAIRFDAYHVFGERIEVIRF
ncbi:MAG: hypothetical protein JRJ86_12470 [Deltaproteobacteria bacterium]|nr:hypothetical protein [Deltaproteobacteria bacterium]MBW2117483.1 hypothetical protein [Deltaproteobacteria bacterium]